MEGASDDPRSPVPGPRLPSVQVVVSVLAMVAASWVCAAVQPAAGESVLLRWLRVLVAHPVRGTLALTFLLLAFRRGPVPDREPPGLGTDGRRE